MFRRHVLPCIVSISVAASMAALATPSVVQAGGVVGNGTPASCTEAALVAALAGGGAITFNCGPNPHTITFTSRKTINANTSLNGAGKISLNGGGDTGFFNLGSARTLTLTALTLTNAGNASSPSSGLGILVTDGTLSISNSTFSQNTRAVISTLSAAGVVTITNSAFISNSSNGFGGALYNAGQLFISDSVFTGNVAPTSYEGGAIYNGGGNAMTQGRATIIRSYFSGNTGGYGGAISNYGALTMTQSTLANNGATFNGGGGGGAIVNGSGGQLLLVNVTVANSTTQPSNRGSALYLNGAVAAPGRATLVNVTMADNAGANGQVHVANLGVVDFKNTLIANGQCTKDATASLTDSGGNLAFNATGCPGTNADPLLEPLQDNGGPTFTRAISSTSPARDSGLNTGCPAYDQRGVVRPQGTQCDIGALEFNAVPIFTSVNPTKVCIGASSAALTFTGSNLIDGPSGTRIKLNNVALPTTFVNSTQLTTIIGAADLAAPPHTLTFTLETPVVDGGISAASHTVEVDICNQPVLGLTATSDAPTLLGNPTQLTATITSGGGVAYVWDFGDGQIGSGANPTHTYANVGSYIATVTATNNLNRMVADTVVNVNLATTGLLVSSFTSEFGGVITYTYVVTHVAPPGALPIQVVISGSVPSNTTLITYTNASPVVTGGDYGNGFVRTAPPVSLQPGQTFTITWIVKPVVLIGDIVNQGHASTDDGRLQVFERDRVRRILIMLAQKP
jgi:PKD domain